MNAQALEYDARPSGAGGAVPGANLPAEGGRPRPTPFAFGDLELVAPHAVDVLVRVWGRPSAGLAFRALIVDSQGEVRSWQADAWDELILLRDIHQQAYPEPVPGGAAQASVLETRYRHALKRLMCAWGDHECFSAVHEDLIVDRRGGRRGWPAAAWAELEMLRSVHKRAYAPH